MFLINFKRGDRQLNLRCVKEIEGFTIGKHYKLLGCVAEYVELKDDNGEECWVYEGIFEIA